VPFNFGWIYFDLNFAVDDAVAFDVDFGGDGRLSQSYMLATHSAEGRFQVGHPATMLASALRYPTGAIPGF
jgi:hypothetical protein